MAEIEYINNPITENASIDDAVDFIKKSNLIINEDSKDVPKEIAEESFLRQAKLQRYKRDTDLKTSFMNFVVCFTWVWSISIITILVLAAYSILNLSDAVIITMLTETVGIIIGLPSIVAWHLFPKN